MKLSNQTQEQTTKLSLHFKDLFIEQKLGRFIYDWIPIDAPEIIIICIGSDRSTGDSLGPIVGSLLAKRKQSRFTIYGTLENPIHALNLVDQLDIIKLRHSNAFIIAIDACLGRSRSVGHINASTGALKPGLAMKKDLPEVGHLNITGMVNVISSFDFLTLHNTRLHLVIQESEIISRALAYFEYLFSENERLSN